MRIFCIWSQCSFIVGVQAGSIGNRVSLFLLLFCFIFWKGTIKISCHKLREFYPLLFSQPVDKCTFENETKSAWVVIIWFKFQHTHTHTHTHAIRCSICFHTVKFISFFFSVACRRNRVKMLVNAFNYQVSLPISQSLYEIRCKGQLLYATKWLSIYGQW